MNYIRVSLTPPPVPGMSAPTWSMRHCIMKGYNDVFTEKANMYCEHLRDGDMVS